jgi:pimeloyl-ACP methyl ester carboxylesterase
MQVHLWRGEQDTNVPAAMGRYQRSAIPNCKAAIYPKGGHRLTHRRFV